MTHQDGLRHGRRTAVAATALAVLLAVVGPLLPHAAPALPGTLGAAAAALAPVLGAPAALAADGIEVRTDARYTVDPGAGVVRVSIDVAARNTRPNSASGGVITRYFYEAVILGIHAEATRVRASAGGTALTVRTSDGGDFRIAEVRLRRNLFYDQRTEFRLQYDLPSGAPRSDSDIRVGSAFATFYVWAFGDAGTVRIEVPAGFDVEHESSDGSLRPADEGAGTVLTAAVADPTDWFAWLNATNEGGLTVDELALPGGQVIVVRGWPEDPDWRTRVGSLLEDGVPVLGELIGLPWPVDGPLDVYEVHTPLLEGYAGFYNLDADEITISEDLDDMTIVHEASHAWFNDELFADRWIYEGLANEYASMALAGMGRPRGGPALVTTGDPAAFPLATWPLPAPIRDEDAEAREIFGYEAAWTVMRRVVASAGEDGMRAVFAAARDRTIAYVGEPDPERDNRPADWRRFLDLLEEEGGATGVDRLFRTWVVDAAGLAALDDRAAARAAYAELLDAADGWLPPVYVRLAMARWAFDDAVRAMAEGTAVLAQRDRTAGLAETVGLEPPEGLEDAWELARTEFTEAAELARDQHGALAEVVEAVEAVGADRDWLTSLGLDGTQAEDALDAARSAWEAGDLDEATAQADTAAALIAAAPDAGRTRVGLIGSVTATGAILVLLVVVLRRRRRDSVAATMAGATMPPIDPGTPAAGTPLGAVASQDAPDCAPEAADAPGGYGTLAGAPREPSPGEAPPAQEGGTSS